MWVDDLLHMICKYHTYHMYFAILIAFPGKPFTVLLTDTIIGIPIGDFLGVIFIVKIIFQNFTLGCRPLSRLKNDGFQTKKENLNFHLDNLDNF